MAGQLQGLDKQYKQATGLDNFNDRLAPETVEALEQTGASAATYGGGIPPDIQAILDKHGGS
jgi:methylmalonyl-CoA mutase cobalamin-binding subunit